MSQFINIFQFNSFHLCRTKKCSKKNFFFGCNPNNINLTVGQNPAGAETCRVNEKAKEAGNWATVELRLSSYGLNQPCHREWQHPETLYNRAAGQIVALVFPLVLMCVCFQHSPPPPWCMGLLMRGLIGANPPTVKLVTSLGWKCKHRTFTNLRLNDQYKASYQIADRNSAFCGLMAQ